MSETLVTRKEAKERTRLRLIESALKLLKEKGLAGMTMNQICRKAGIAQPSFYNHYPALYDLLCDVRIHMNEVYREPAKQCFLNQLALYEQGEKSVDEVLQVFFRHIIDALLGDIEIFKTILADHYDKSGPAGGALGLIMDETRDHWCKFFNALARGKSLNLTDMQMNLYIDSLSALSHQLVLGCHEQRYGKSRAVDALVNLAKYHIDDLTRRHKVHAL
ncbi:HTH-type transcriptional repressor FabR [Thalassocella blandensis]|nr:HTH-type transcriptional repressor FabR [Thalassocella blandensis]